MNYTQSIVADLMKASTFNNFNGEHVVRALEENSTLWRGFVWGRFGAYAELIPLRDIEDDQYNADTLYILPVAGKELELELLVRERFGADEVDWVGGREACDLLGSWSEEKAAIQKAILRVWWD